MLGVGDDFGVSAFLVFEGAVEVVTDSVTSAEVVESSVEVVIWSIVEAELPVAAEEGAREVAFAAPEAEAEPSDAAESGRFHCGKDLTALV